MRYLTDIVLILLRCADKESNDGWFHGITRMEKVIFLLQQERSLDKWIEDDKPDFAAYKLGPYSQKVYTAVEFLSTYDLVEDSIFLGESRLDAFEEAIALEMEHIQYSERRFRLTSTGRKAAETLVQRTDNRILHAISEYYRNFGNLHLPKLLRYVYSKYPEYTGESIIKDSVMKSP